MWLKKIFYILFFVLFASAVLVGQDTDLEKVKLNQFKIISIAQQLIESNSSQGIILEQKEFELTQKEQSLSQIEADLQMKENFYLQMEKDLQILQDSLKIQSESLSKYKRANKYLKYGLFGLSFVTGILILSK